MVWLMWLISAYVFYYTAGLAKQVFKHENKPAAVVLALIAVAVLVIPYFWLDMK